MSRRQRLRMAALVLWLGCAFPPVGGAATQATLVKDINAQPFSSRPSDLTAVGEQLFFLADSGFGRHLWRTRGDAADVEQLGDADRAAEIGVFAPDRVVFSNYPHGRAELWISDGTQAGTTRLGDFGPMSISGPSLFSFESVGARLFFLARDERGLVTLWRTDGSSDGTAPVIDRVSVLAPLGDAVYFFRGDELWRSDGTTAGSERLADGLSSSLQPPRLSACGGLLYYFTRTVAGGELLWRTDGTPIGTASLRTLGFLNRTLCREGVLYVHDEANRQSRYWRTDGTPGGTRQIAAFPEPETPLPTAEEPMQIGAGVAFKGLLFFAGDDGAQTELWQWDGTPGSARLHADPAPGTGDAWPAHLVAFDGSVFLSADDGLAGAELWRSDGTADGTFLVADLKFEQSGPFSYGSSSSPSWLTVVAEHLCFSADSGFFGRELFCSDGTDEGTTRLTNIAQHSYEGSNPSDLTALGSALLFAASDNRYFDRPAYGAELYRARPETRSTGLVLDIEPGEYSSAPRVAAHSATLAYFAANSAISGRELWRTDGSADGTTLVRDINLGANSSSPSRGCLLGGRLLFAADDGATGGELWLSDGTAEGTALVADLRPGPDGSAPELLTCVEDVAYFTADDGEHGRELWISDATPNGTRRITAIAPDSGASEPGELTPLPGGLVFSAIDARHGRELWRADANGAQLLRDIEPGETGSNPGSLVRIGDRIVFRACNAAGCELWRSDGTPSGTRLVADINPGAGSASPDGFLAYDDQLLFRAAQPGVGIELFRLPLAALHECPADCNGDARVSPPEIIAAIMQALDRDAPGCSAADGDGDLRVSVDEIVAAVGRREAC